MSSARVRGGLLLAIDVGTTTVRAILFDLEGRPLSEAYREPMVLHPRPGWAEVEPEDWWRCVAAVTRQALQGAPGAGERIVGVGLAGLMHALVPLDRAGRPLARAQLWMDQRCQPQAEWLMREHRPLIRGVLGPRPVTTTWSAPKLRWLSEHQPELVQRAHSFLSVKDFVRFRLTGTIATDPSDAGGTGLFDPQRGEWSQPLLELVGVSREQMAPIRDSSEVAGPVRPEAASLTGLAAGTPVVIGGSDVKCTRIGAGAYESDRGCLYLGTSAWIAGPQRRPGSFGATATTGAALKWLVRLFALADGDAPGAAYAALLEEAATVAAGAEGLIFLPHLMGERGPRYDPQARGVLFGLTLAHGRAQIARAVLEGCALHLRSILDSLGSEPPREIVTVGGGARSALWRQIIADATGACLLVPRVLEAGALGAAILAGVGLGVYPSVQVAADRLVEIVEQREPEPASRALYSRIYRLYLELEERVAPLYAQVPVESGEEV